MTWKRRGLLILLEAGLWAACVLALAGLYDSWFTPGPHGPVRWVGMDFVPYWVGVRQMLAGLSPYSGATTHLIQSTLLGGPPAPGGDPMLFVYPAWIFVVLIPWALLPLKAAAAVWTGSLLFGTFHLLGALALRWGGRNLFRTGLWAVALALGSLPFLAISVTKGQLGLVSLGALFLSIRLVSGPLLQPEPSPQERQKSFFGHMPFPDILAGVCLMLAILKPTLTVPAAAGLLLWALFERKGGVIVGFAAALSALAIASLLAAGNWIPAYLQVLGDTGGAPVLWSLAFLAWPWKILYVLLFMGIGVFALVRWVRLRLRSQWFSAVILAGLALFPMRWIYDLLLGILVPAETADLRGWPAAAVVIALLAPWGLALFPETWRWPAEVIGLPLAWAVVWWIQALPLARVRVGAPQLA